MQAYKDLINFILDNGIMVPSRAGNALTAPDYMMVHKMSDGFPLLTMRKMPWIGITVELEGFLKGITDKKWYQDNNCSFWNEWANQKYVNEELKKHPEKIRCDVQKEERDIFAGYGFEWLHAGAEYKGYNQDYSGKGVNQVNGVIEALKKNVFDRQSLVVAWNPVNKAEYALPPCIYAYHFKSIDGKNLDLTYNQRSGDTCLGIPNDFASGALFLELMAKTLNMSAGRLTATLSIPHIYEQHLDGAKELLKREPKKLPKLELTKDVNIFNFEAKKAELKDYICESRIRFERNV